MVCKKCGAELIEGARFCSECGAKVEVDDVNDNMNGTCGSCESDKTLKSGCKDDAVREDHTDNAAEAENTDGSAKAEHTDATEKSEHNDTAGRNVYKEALNQAKSDIKTGAGKAGAYAKNVVGRAEDVTKKTFTAAGSAMGSAVSDVESTISRATSNSSSLHPENTGALRTNRNIFAFILLSIITCNIYSYYNIYAIARDVNIACFDDDEETPGLLVYILLSFVTCGLYNLYWLYKIGNRLAKNASYYGVEMRENGTHIILWKILGVLICCIGTYYGDYLLLKNTNLICDAYNRKYGYAAIG